MQIQQASTLLVGCPACDHNFKHFFCSLTCHPDQSTFVNVTDVQLTADTNVTAVKQVSRLCHQLRLCLLSAVRSSGACLCCLQAAYYIADAFGTTFYDSCKVLTNLGPSVLKPCISAPPASKVCGQPYLANIESSTAGVAVD